MVDMEAGLTTVIIIVANMPGIDDEEASALPLARHHA